MNAVMQTTRWWVDDCRLVQNWIHLVIRPCVRWLGLGSHINYMNFQMNNHLKAMRPWWLIPIGLIHLTCWTPFQHKLHFHEPSNTGSIRLHLWLHAPSRIWFKPSETARVTVALASLAPSIGTTSRFPGTSVDHDNDNLWFFHNKHKPSVIVRLQGINIPKQNGKNKWRFASWYRNHSSDAILFHSSGDTVKVYLALEGIYQLI